MTYMIEFITIYVILSVILAVILLASIFISYEIRSIKDSIENNDISIDEEDFAEAEFNMCMASNKDVREKILQILALRRAALNNYSKCNNEIEAEIKFIAGLERDIEMNLVYYNEDEEEL